MYGSHGQRKKSDVGIFKRWTHTLTRLSSTLPIRRSVDSAERRVTGAKSLHFDSVESRKEEEEIKQSEVRSMSKQRKMSNTPFEG
jgi:hypothetical protein